MATESPKFGGFLGGWQAAQDRRQEMLERNRYNAAQNALIDIYGAVAGDPNANATLSATGRAEELQPYEVRSRQLGNDTAAEDLSYKQEVRPYGVESARLGNISTVLGNTGKQQTIDQSAAAFPLEQETRTLNNRRTSQAIDQGDAAFPIEQETRTLNNTAQAGKNTDDDTARKKAALLSGTNMLLSVRDSGGDLAQAFDRLVPTLQTMGIPDGEISQVRSQVVADPSTLDAILAGLSDPNTAAARAAQRTTDKLLTQGYVLSPDGKSMTLVEGGPAWQKAQSAKAKADAKGGTPTARKIEDSIYETDRMMTTVDKAIKQAGSNTATGFIGQTLGGIGGTDALALRATINTLQSNISFDKLQKMRAESPTGGALGNVSDRDLALLASTVASLDADQPQAQLVENLNTVKASYARLRALLEQDKAAAAAQPAPAAKSGGYDLDDNAAAGQPDGTIVEDDAGKRYVVQGGQLVPQ